jgi:hypothetical protein
MQDRSTIVQTTTKLLHEDFKAKKISLEDFMAAAYVISEVKDPEDLMAALLIFKEKYSCFGDALNMLEQEEREEFEHLLKLAIPKIMLEKPELASKVLEFAQDRKVDMDDLEEKFPEAVAYFEKFMDQDSNESDT